MLGARLFKVGSMADSLTAYVPAMIFQKGLGFGRVFLLMYLLAAHPAEYGLWGVAIMVFTLAAPLMNLGSNHGVTRYTSVYEAQGEFCCFYRRVRWCVLGCVLVMLLIGVAVSWPLTWWALTPKGNVIGVGETQRLYICLFAMVNAAAMGLYFNLIGLLTGMRAYRMTAFVEVLFSVMFTVLGAAAAWLWPSAMAVLGAHALSVLFALAVGIIMINIGIRRNLFNTTESSTRPLEEEVSSAEALDEPIVTPPVAAVSIKPCDAVIGAFAKVLSYGLVAMLGTFLWLGAQYVSYYLILREVGERRFSPFLFFFQVSQLVLFLANAIWAVVYTHVARQWEAGQKGAAMDTLQAAYKGVTMTTMTLTVVIYLLSPWWVLILPQRFQQAAGAIGGLLMYFQFVCNLALTTMVANLRMRPIVVVMTALGGIVVNAALALWWISTATPEMVLERGALAAGIGMFLGAGAISGIFFLLGRVRLELGTLFVFLCPALLVFGEKIAAGVWAAVLVVTFLTGWILTHRQKRLLKGFLARVWKTLKGATPWQRR